MGLETSMTKLTVNDQSDDVEVRCVDSWIRAAPFQTPPYLIFFEFGWCALLDFTGKLQAGSHGAPLWRSNYIVVVSHDGAITTIARRM
jgi:hypothetical protein